MSAPVIFLIVAVFLLFVLIPLLLWVDEQLEKQQEEDIARKVLDSPIDNG